MSLIEAVIGPVGKLLDKIIPDPEARDRAKLELLKLEGDQEMRTIGAQMEAIVAEARSAGRGWSTGRTTAPRRRSPASGRQWSPFPGRPGA